KLANLSADLEIMADADTAATVAVTYDPPIGKGSAGHAERNVRLHAGTNRVELPLQIENPARWFPAGHGAQDLYRFQASIAVKGASTDEASVRTGLRSLELRRQPDQWGKSFEFVV